MVHFIPEYDEKTVPKLKDELADLGRGQLQAVASYEEANKNRVTLLDAIDRELEQRGDDDGDPGSVELDTDGDSETRPTEAPDRAGSVGGTDEPSEDGDAETPATEQSVETGARGVAENSPRTVTVRAPGRGYFGGLWFDDAGSRDVQLTARVRTALQETALERLDG